MGTLEDHIQKEDPKKVGSDESEYSSSFFAPFQDLNISTRKKKNHLAMRIARIRMTRSMHSPMVGVINGLAV